MALLADTYTDWYVSPGGLLLAYVVVVLIVAASAGCAVVTALKGRWVWLLVGLLLVGLPWLVSAWLPARPGSPWARRRRDAG